jgi:hypothetical protein
MLKPLSSKAAYGSATSKCLGCLSHNDSRFIRRMKQPKRVEHAQSFGLWRNDSLHYRPWKAGTTTLSLPLILLDLCPEATNAIIEIHPRFTEESWLVNIYTSMEELLVDVNRSCKTRRFCP